MGQVKNLNLRLEQESHKRSLSQSELKMQTQQVSVLRSSEKQLKQELNHLLDMKQTLDKQNQELRRFKPNELIQHTAPAFCHSEQSASALWVVGEQRRLTGCWLFSREKQEVGGQLKELKDQLEAEQYFTVIPNRSFLHISAPSPQNRSSGGNV